VPYGIDTGALGSLMDDGIDWASWLTVSKLGKGLSSRRKMARASVLYCQAVEWADPLGCLDGRRPKPAAKLRWRHIPIIAALL